ncbi:Protein xmas-2 [Eumeta japonica]|uniref:Protein xmas-2 n=1 Tax=Eumeta variegata TaxID=151549 RepID=A0A4C1V2L1_EUMVA|nr:Protein xmas-2 [Eumeta japonica]
MHKMASPQHKKQKNLLNHSKTSVTCTNMPESLFDAAAAKRHFSKFGRVTKILMRPKHHMCIIEYDSPIAAERAVLNAGAYDGFTFDVTRQRMRRSKKEDDPDWLPDSDVEEELSAMSGVPIQRSTRQKPMDVEKPERAKKIVMFKGKKVTKRKEEDIVFPEVSTTESSMTSSTMASTLSTSDAALELHQLRSRIANVPDEQWRILDARDKILRSWGGTGARVKIGGATIGTCPDMCPEKERLHRQAEHQVMTLETNLNSEGLMEPTRAVKQYSRSSADQEIPMCYELRPPRVLLMTCSYLLNEIADTERQVSLADWFHFMWDRLRGIRKDITQQGLCCGDSIRLVEMCARFHAHCAARLADLEHTQFDQKLNTDNLTKCLQTLKHMYADVSVEDKPNEAEFRGYIALLNLGDSNFWWELKRLPQEIQKSESITFVMQVFNALDNNNYVRFFRLIKEKATYLQACILLRYFNDVRARALARIVKSYSPRGGSRYPAHELMLSLAFESPESMKAFISHYGLRFGKVDDGELSVILDRNQFIEDSDPYPIARARTLIESKRKCSVGETIAGGLLPEKNYSNHSLHTSFNKNGNLKELALLAEDQNYNTLNDSNRNVNSLKAELEKLNDDKSNISRKPNEQQQVLAKPVVNQKIISAKYENERENTNAPDLFTFVKPTKIVSKFTMGLEIDTIDKFVFSSPYRMKKIVSDGTILKIEHGKAVFKKETPVFTELKSKDILFKVNKTGNNSIFNQSSSKAVGNGNSATNSLFNASNNLLQNNKAFASTMPSQLFSEASNSNIFQKKNEQKSFVQQNSSQNNPFTQKDESIFGSASITGQKTNNIFAKPIQNCNDKVQDMDPKNLFRSVQPNSDSSEGVNKAKSIFGNASKNTTGLINGTDGKYSIFKNSNSVQHSLAANIFNSAKSLNDNVYDFNAKLEDSVLKRDSDEHSTLREHKLSQIKYLEEQRKLEELQREELRKQELRKLEEEKALQEEKRKQELRQEEKRKQEERVKEELKKRLEEEKRQAEEQKRKEEEEEEKRNRRRRNLLDETPVWLPDHSPEQEAKCLKRRAERSVLENMKALRKGNKFATGLKTSPTPQPYDIMEIVKSSMLKKGRHIKYTCDKCCFWKVTLVIKGANTWINRKVELKPFLLRLFSDNMRHESECLIQVKKYSLKNLMDFGISVSLVDEQKNNNFSEALDGTNALLFYVSENDDTIMSRIESILRCKYAYQLVPLVVITSCKDTSAISAMKNQLSEYVNQRLISRYKIGLVNNENIFESLDILTNTSLKWLAKHSPSAPRLEVDLVKSICQRYLGTEIWCRLKSERQNRLSSVLSNPNKLIEIYNLAVDKLTAIITDENLFNYPLFPLELRKYLNHTNPYPKPNEYITSNLRTTENVSAIKDIMKHLKLIQSPTNFRAFDLESMQEQIRDYCIRIGWFDDPEGVLCKVVATMSDEFSHLESTRDQIGQHYETYDIMDVLNVVVYEKINSISDSKGLLAIYDKATLDDYRIAQWWYETKVVTNRKHKIDIKEDEVDCVIAAKRRKLSESMYNTLILHENDVTMVEESIKAADITISRLQCLNKTVEELELKVEKQKLKSTEFENMLKAALMNINYITELEVASTLVAMTLNSMQKRCGRPGSVHPQHSLVMLPLARTRAPSMDGYHPWRELKENYAQWLHR